MKSKYVFFIKWDSSVEDALESLRGHEGIEYEEQPGGYLIKAKKLEDIFWLGYDAGGYN